MKLIEEKNPCDGCENKDIDDYGMVCDLSCGKNSVWRIRKKAKEDQLKEDKKWFINHMTSKEKSINGRIKCVINLGENEYTGMYQDAKDTVCTCSKEKDSIRIDCPNCGSRDSYRMDTKFGHKYLCNRCNWYWEL